MTKTPPAGPWGPLVNLPLMYYQQYTCICIGICIRTFKRGPGAAPEHIKTRPEFREPKMSPRKCWMLFWKSRQLLMPFWMNWRQTPCLSWQINNKHNNLTTKQIEYANEQRNAGLTKQTNISAGRNTFSKVQELLFQINWQQTRCLCRKIYIYLTNKQTKQTNEQQMLNWKSKQTNGKCCLFNSKVQELLFQMNWNRCAVSPRQINKQTNKIYRQTKACRINQHICRRK